MHYDQQIRKQYTGGQCIASLASEFNITRVSVYAALKRTGWKPGTITDERERAIRCLKLHGWSDEAIAKALSAQVIPAVPKYTKPPKA